MAEIAVETPSPATVLSNHFLGLGCLVLIMGRLGVLILLLGLPLLLLHHPLSLAHGPTRAAGSTRNGTQQHQYHQKNSDSFHCWTIINLQRYVILGKTSNFAA